VRHTTGYDYAVPVDLASHMLHLRPRALPYQQVLQQRLLVRPPPARRTEGRDYFGNDVSWLFLDAPHEHFAVTLEAVVDVAFPPPPAPETTPPWEAVAAAAQFGAAEGWQAAEFLYESPMVVFHRSARDFCACSFAPGRPVLSGLQEVCGRIRREFAFRAGVTAVATPVAKVMALRAGVCQDFAHVMIAGLRMLGLPARYVSGYLRTRPPPGKPRMQGADASHAWVGCWLGPAHGWVDLDPTNDLVVSDGHVVLGWGRDYGDVSPVRGIILGGGKHEVEVGVDLEPV
jgi:transglutaminase-like putative cysteine protease